MVIITYVIFILLTTRQNFFMDITTAIIFTHYLYYFINDRINVIDNYVLSKYLKWTGAEWWTLLIFFMIFLIFCFF